MDPSRSLRGRSCLQARANVAYHPVWKDRQTQIVRTAVAFTLAILAVGAAILIIKSITVKKISNPSGEWPAEVVAKIPKDRSARDAVRNHDPQLFAAVSAAMFKHDPIGINFNTNADEYEPEAGTVIPRLHECSSAGDVSRVLHEEFVVWFSAETAGAESRYKNLAEEIWTIWRANQTEPSGPANLSQPIGLETNRTSPAPDSGH